LVRLATSAHLAPARGTGRREMCGAILEGYRDGLAKPRPTLLDEQETWMRPLVACTDKDRKRFWAKIDALKAATPAADAAAGLKSVLPPGAAVLRYAASVKGSGSLGRPRYVAVASWCGGRVVREAKALIPSAWDWAHGTTAHRSRF